MSKWSIQQIAYTSMCVWEWVIEFAKQEGDDNQYSRVAETMDGAVGFRTYVHEQMVPAICAGIEEGAKICKVDAWAGNSKSYDWDYIPRFMEWWWNEVVTSPDLELPVDRDMEKQAALLYIEFNMDEKAMSHFIYNEYYERI